jgi:surface protein
MSNMFRGATVFNRDISSWDVGSVTGMYYMFLEAIAFEQNIGSWDITNVTGMDGMFTSVALTATNYDALLAGWSRQSVKPNIAFHA